MPGIISKVEPSTKLALQQIYNFILDNTTKLQTAVGDLHYAQGANGKRGEIFLEDVAKQDPLYREYMRHLGALKNLTKSSTDPDEIAEYNALKWMLNSQLNAFLRKKDFWAPAPDATISGTATETELFMKNHPEYIIELWNDPTIKKINSVIFDPHISYLQDSAPFLTLLLKDQINWYNLDTKYRITKNAETIEPVLFTDPFLTLQVNLVDVNHNKLAGWQSTNEINLINSIYGKDPSCFAHEFHHYLRRLLQKTRKNGFSSQDDLAYRLVDTIKLQGTGYTQQEADLLDLAYNFSDEFLNKYPEIIPLYEKGATNAELRFDIATHYGKYGKPLYGKELDDTIKLMSDEELINCMKRVDSTTNKMHAINGYAADFMRNTDELIKRLPYIRKALIEVAYNDTPTDTSELYYAKNGIKIKKRFQKHV